MFGKGSESIWKFLAARRAGERGHQQQNWVTDMLEAPEYTINLAIAVASTLARAILAFASSLAFAIRAFASFSLIDDTSAIHVVIVSITEKE